VRYRLNRWREEQFINGVKLTYGDLGMDGEFDAVQLPRGPQRAIACLRNCEFHTRARSRERWAFLVGNLSIVIEGIL
jgi:hypothetical protein